MRLKNLNLMRLNAECVIALFCQKTHEHPAVCIPPDTEIKTQTLWFWTVRIWLSCMIALKEQRLCHATFIKPRPTTFRWKYWYASELFSPELAKYACLFNLMQCLQVHLLDLKAEVWLHSVVWGVTVGVPTFVKLLWERGFVYPYYTKTPIPAQW